MWPPSAEGCRARSRDSRRSALSRRVVPPPIGETLLDPGGVNGLPGTELAAPLPYEREGPVGIGSSLARLMLKGDHGDVISAQFVAITDSDTDQINTNSDRSF